MGVTMMMMMMQRFCRSFINDIVTLPKDKPMIIKGIDNNFMLGHSIRKYFVKNNIFLNFI